jgi:site-specific DNA-methyltransferase (adenine-specific)
MIELTEIIGAYGKVNRGGAVANWEAGRNVPSREQYSKLVAALEATGHVGTMLPYEDVVRPMQVSRSVRFTDVWDFPSVRPFKGKHPAEKPQDMLMHMIAASTYPGDVVLDCFAGSGSTGAASVRLGCRAVCMEIEDRWIARAVRELRAARSEDFVPPDERPRGAADLSVDRLFD